MSSELVTWVEIDLKRCTNSWGVGDCTAALSNDTPNKCFNTFKTCGDTDNYNAVVTTIKLTPKGQVGLPFDGRYFPCLTSVKESGQTVNIAGSDKKLSALGKRASATIKFSDFVYTDKFLDEHYDGRIDGTAQLSGVGYEPAGMLWSRLRARDPYFAGYDLRIKQGRVVGGAVVTDRTVNYIMTEFNASNGAAEIEAVDVLDLAANDRAKIPIASVGQLGEDINAAQTTFILDEGSGEDYAASGYVTVGKEIMSFTRSGDTMTVRRGAFDSVAEAHSNGDSVQQAYRFTGKAHEALADMLLNYANVPTDWVPSEEWEDEAITWFNIDVDAIITKPMEVIKAIGEISILGFSLYTDLAEKKIRFKPNRFLFYDEKQSMPLITDDSIIGDVEIDGRDDERLTRVEFRHVQIDPHDGVKDSNFKRGYMTIDAEKEDPRAHGDIRYKLEKTRWLNNGNNVAVRILANRYLRRFKTSPERITLTVKSRDYGNLDLVSHVGIMSRYLPDETGQVSPRIFQVLKKTDKLEKGRFNGEVELTLQRFEYDGNFGFWAPNDAPDYDSASEEQKGQMAFWGGNTGETFSDGRKYYEWG